MTELSAVMESLESSTQEMARKVARFREKINSLSESERDALRRTLIARIASSLNTTNESKA